MRKFFLFLVLGCIAIQFSSCKKYSSGAYSGSSISSDSKILLPLKGSDIGELAKKSSQPLTLVNLWASWCYPCRQEFPELIRFYREWSTKGVDLKFVSVDLGFQREDALQFLREQKVDFETYIKDEDDSDFIKSMDPTWKGLLPTTYLYDKSGKILARFDEPLTKAELEERIASFRSNPKP
jgi:thiol-disulfide isomerase/thioredoxin